MTTTIAARLARFRAAFAAEGCQAALVLSADPHLSEYLPEHWQVREWLSGFTGSAGTLLVTETQAGLWTDSRYWEQAQAQLAGSGIVLMRQGGDAPGMGEWLAQQMPQGGRLAVDVQTLSLSAAERLSNELRPYDWRWQAAFADGAQAWWPDRPALPAAPIWVHTLDWAAESRSAKLARLRAAMREQDADWHVISALDEIAWLFNLRGSDVAYNPVFLAHALVPASGPVTLFVDLARLPLAVQAELAEDNVRCQPYESFEAALRALDHGRVWLDPSAVVVGVANAVSDAVVPLRAANPCRGFKACKLPAQQVHIRQTMVQDGAALCEFFAWFEQALARGEPLTELTVDEQLTAARARRPGFISLSFPTIAGYNANGAMPHYRALPSAFAALEGDGLLLIDSGAQFLGGTTDITRVVPVGQPSDAQKRDFTLVLQGMIALSRARFPAGVSGQALDVLARQPLWAQGLDYGHGTGHGVGYCLNVHEGPQSISWRAPATVALQAGMVTSNEPGLYRPGQWGIRIENLVLTVPAETTPFGDFLRFETLTLCPIDSRCIVVDMLSDAELQWLNDYHAEVRARLAPLLQGDALQWLRSRTEPLTR